MNYKVSIIVPYYKKKFFIFDAIKSVLNQNYKNFEIIIIYDDSTKADLGYIKKIAKFNKFYPENFTRRRRIKSY